MSLQAFTLPFIAGALLFGAGCVCADETPVERLERENRQLQLQLRNLRQTLAASLQREEAKTAALKEIREYLALFGKDLFDGGDRKVLQAVSDYQVVSERLNELDHAATNLLPVLKNYLQTAVASDPEARLSVESHLRELEAAIGMRRRPQRKIEQGTTQEARVVTVDSETGAIVVNAGEDAGFTVGMLFRIERSGSSIGDAIVAATRPNVSGLLMQNLKDSDVPAQPGDFAKIILNTDPTD
jgi:hypothetical protein